MQLPRLVVNAKAYPEALGPALVRLARACSKEAGAADATVALAVPATEVQRIAALRLPGLQVWGQHADAAALGAATGTVLPEQLHAAGAVATLLNHAERKLGRDGVAAAVARCAQAKLPVLACADSVAEARNLAGLRPWAVAIEPPELIGGAVSVTSADPAIVRNAVAQVRKVQPRLPVLCGAGVKSGADAAAARRLGAHGVLLASGVVKAKRPALALRDLLAGLA